jgi:BolA protein|tara:strand:- start:20782 stop:21105 length:324 start_codon:yes stop_codon:yes gene_type:complete
MTNIQDMTMEQTIRNKIEQNLAPGTLEILNESHMHSGPAANSHFKLTVVSSAFEGKRPVARHQLVYKVLADELAGEVHALALHVFTPEEWMQAGGAIEPSPKCKGGH